MKKTKCMKCGYESEKNKKKFGLVLCSICYVFSPDEPDLLDEYISEKISFRELESFRRFYNPRGEKQKKGMHEKAFNGQPVTRPPFGYRLENKKLVPDENSKKIIEIFEEFLNKEISLNKLAKKYGFSVNGLKKILTNFTYVGKIKFNGEIHDGTHEPLVSSTVFNHVQDKLEKIKKI